jgi:hypothetical protein
VTTTDLGAGAVHFPVRISELQLPAIHPRATRQLIAENRVENARDFEVDMLALISQEM